MKSWYEWPQWASVVYIISALYILKKDNKWKQGGTRKKYDIHENSICEKL